MADEEELEAPPETPPAPEPVAEKVIVLAEWTEVDGEMLPKGKVMRLGANIADPLIAANKAREATEFERRIGGV